jgi:hypothetical protein
LVYRLPDDINDKTGVMFESKSNAPEENLFFAGVYQIVKIESKITNGQFLQTLTCVRLNNQSGAGEPLFEVRAVTAGEFTDANSYKKNSARILKDSLEKVKQREILENFEKIEEAYGKINGS